MYRLSQAFARHHITNHLFDVLAKLLAANL
jgi:hypothetical protein